MAFCTPTAAKDAVSGYVAVQGEVKKTTSSGVDAIAEMKYATPRFNKTRAVIKVEGSYYDRTLALEDVFLDYKPDERMKFTLGISKKILGLEYEYDKEYRATIHRSPIYQKMERLGIVGRQLNLRMLSTPARRKKSWKLSGAVGVDGSRDLNAQFSVQAHYGALGVGAWVIAEAHKVSRLYSPMLAATFSMWGESARTRATLEAFDGIDTQRSEYHKTFGEGRTVVFFGVKAEVLHEYELTDHLVLSPVVQSSFWFDDVRRSSDNSLQFLVAARISMQRLVLSVNAAVTGESRESTGKRDFSGGAVYGETLFFF
jgi:hypothetical protein